MLCPRCGTSVGDSARLCSACATTESLLAPTHSTSKVSRTTHQTTISDEPGGFWLRFFATLIDSTILGIINWFVFDLIIMGLLKWNLRVHLETVLEKLSAGSTNSTNLTDLNIVGTLFQLAVPLFIALITMLVIGIIYYPAFESSKFQATPGKLALGLLVTDLQTQPLSFLRALLRQISKLLSVLSLGIGFLMAGFTARKQTLHDMVASSLVLKNPRVSANQRLLAAVGSVVMVITFKYLSPHSTQRLEIIPISVSRVTMSIAPTPDDIPLIPNNELSKLLLKQGRTGYMTAIITGSVPNYQIVLFAGEGEFQDSVYDRTKQTVNGCGLPAQKSNNEIVLLNKDCTFDYVKFLVEKRDGIFRTLTTNENWDKNGDIQNCYFAITRF